MSVQLTLRMSNAVYTQALNHLLPGHSRIEQGGFVFAEYDEASAGGAMLTCFEWLPLGVADYVEQHCDYLELTDRARGRVIKHAHDLGACLVEFHSHPGPYPAAFSASDLRGLNDFVPHVRWRLQSRPYAAVVVAPTGFDALAWVGSSAVQLGAIDTGAKVFKATALTLAPKSRPYRVPI